MSFDSTVCVLADVQARVGAAISASFTEAMQNSVGLATEGYLSSIMGYNVVTNFASMKSPMKLMVTEYVASMIAVYAIIWDLGTDSLARTQKEIMLSLNWARIERIDEDIRSENIKTFMEA